MVMIDQVFPIRKQVPLEGLYLAQNLMGLAAKIGRSIVLTDFLTDENGVVAKAGRNAHFEVPTELKNPSDWGLFQELMAQADVLISGGSYFKRLARTGAQDILYQFEDGNPYERLGNWRLSAGYTTRSPDLAIVTRHLDFELPEGLLKSGRKIVILTRDSMAGSTKARNLMETGVAVIGSGKRGVEGGRLITVLADGLSYRVIMMVSGPRVLELLLAANRLDLFYVTQAQVAIPFDDPATVQTVLAGGKKVSQLEGFHLTHHFIQENVTAENGSTLSQSFLRYDWNDLRE